MLLSKFARAVQRVPCRVYIWNGVRWSTEKGITRWSQIGAQQRWASDQSPAKLTRPGSMDTVRHTDDIQMAKWWGITCVLLGLYIIVMWIDMESRWFHFYKEQDSEKDFEAMKKAGVFMSIRPDGTYRQFYSRKTMYTSEPVVQRRDEDGNLVYKEDLGIAMKEAKTRFMKNSTGEERRRVQLDAELTKLAFDAVEVDMADDFGKALADLAQIQENLIMQNEDISTESPLLMEDYDGPKQEILANFLQVANAVKEAFEEVGPEDASEEGFDYARAAHMAKDHKMMRRMMVWRERYEAAPENVKALLSFIFAEGDLVQQDPMIALRMKYDM